MRKHFRITIITAFLCLLSLACGLTFSAPNEESQSDLVSTQVALAVQQTAAALQSGADAAPLEQAAEPNFEFSGISLSIPAPFSASGEVVPSDLEMEAFWGAPEHERVNLQSYPVANDYFQAGIHIYPVDVYSNASQNAAERITDLKAMLAERPAKPQVNEVPFLPLVNAGRMGMLKFAFLNFQNGSGVRFITQLGQAFFPFNNRSMIYTFQGLTQDGRYYISALLPIAHHSLDMYNDIELSEDFYNNAEQFLTEQVAGLEAQTDDSFLPTISTLDAMLASLRIDK